MMHNCDRQHARRAAAGGRFSAGKKRKVWAW